MDEERLQFVKGALAGFGLNEVESAVYSAALELGSRQVSKIAKQAGLNRTYTYDILSSLAKKGLVQEVVKNNVKHFSCASPERLVDLLEVEESKLAKQKKVLLSALPQLEKMQNPFSGQPAVRYFQGVDAIKTVFEDTLSEPDQTIYGFVDADYSSNLTGDELASWRESYTARRVANDNWFFAIVNDCGERGEKGKKASSSAALKRKTKVLNNTSIPFEVIVYGNRVAVLSTYEEKLGLIVESKNIASAVRNLHRSIWESLPG